MTIELPVVLALVIAILFFLLRWAIRPRNYGTDPRYPRQHPWVDRYGRVLREVLRPLSRSVRR